MKIAVVGLGKIGCTHAALLALKDYTVLGVDNNPIVIAALNKGKAPVPETGLQEVLNQVQDKFSVTNDTAVAIAQAEVIFITLPTPSDQYGRFSSHLLVQAAHEIGQGLKLNNHYPVIVLRSTVMAGETEAQFIPVLEKVSGKKLGQDFGVCFSPHFIALGSIVKDILNPSIVVIGSSDQYSGDIVEQISQRLAENNPYIARMNIINAELTKLSADSFLSAKISYTNTVVQICGGYPDADAAVVLDAMCHDAKVVGSKGLKIGLPFGGPCFPRDNLAFQRVAEKVGVTSLMTQATDEQNEFFTTYLTDLITKTIRQRQASRIAILGLAYKPDTPVITCSYPIQLAKYLLRQNLQVWAYDPQAMENARNEVAGLHLADSLAQALNSAQVIIITTAWSEFKSITPDQIASNSCIIDCWRILSSESWQDNLIVLGKGQIC